MLNLRNDLPSLEYVSRQSPLSPDATLLLYNGQDLQSRVQQTPRCPELEDYALYMNTLLVGRYSREIAQGLRDATRLKLALVTRHFDSSSREPLPNTPCVL